MCKPLGCHPALQVHAGGMRGTIVSSFLAAVIAMVSCADRLSCSDYKHNGRFAKAGTCD